MTGDHHTGDAGFPVISFFDTRSFVAVVILSGTILQFKNKRGSSKTS